MFHKIRPLQSQVVKAQNRLGYMYKKGLGVKQDYKKAFEWYQKSAEQDNSYAQNNLGYNYEKGFGVEQNYKKAFEWYQKSAEQDNSYAQNNLADMYKKGLGVKQDYKKAFEWYQKSAEQDNSYAQNNIGYLFYNGLGMDKDYKKAFELYQKSANQENAEAQYNLGLLYEYGYGVSKNYIISYSYYLLSNYYENNSATAEVKTDLDMTKKQKEIAKKYNPLGVIAIPAKEVFKESNSFKASGTGFFINDNYLLTSKYAVKNCLNIILDSDNFHSKANIYKLDLNSELVLLNSEKVGSKIPLRKEASVKFNDKALVMGYPQGIDIRYTGEKITKLDVSLDKSKYLQLSVEVDEKNSGGVLLSESGSAVGLLVDLENKSLTKENALNTAINLKTIKNFLDLSKIIYSTKTDNFITRSLVTIVNNTHRGVVRVSCEIK